MCGGRKVKELTPVTTPQLNAVRSFPCTGVDATCGGGSAAGPANAANICTSGTCNDAKVCFEAMGYVSPSFVCLLSLIDKRISPSFVCLLSLIDKRTFAIRVSVYIPGRYVYLVFAIPTCDTGSSIQTLTCVFTGHLLLFSFLLFSLLLFSLLLFFLLLFSLLLFSLLLFSPVVRRGPTSLPPTRAQVQLPRCG